MPQSSLSDLLLYEHHATPGVPISDVREASNYVAAVSHGVELLRGGLPVSTRMLKAVHGVLMDGVRADRVSPGEFRKSQNWIGGTRPGTARYVPPPWPEAREAMSSLERFLKDPDDRTPAMLKAGLAHAQFETIHPFLDGNGRVGRALITLQLLADGLISQPILYLSLYLKQHRDLYYDLLQRVRTHGEWERWLAFFLEGVAEVAQQTTSTTIKILKLVERDLARTRELGRASATAERVFDFAAHNLVCVPQDVARALQMSEPPVYKALAHLEKLGILEEATGRARGRAFVYHEFLTLLNA